MSEPLGGRAWALRNQGSLTHREQLRLATQGILVQLNGLSGRTRAWLASSSSSSALVSGRKPPDSKLAREALELATDASSGSLRGHCLRCWLWADLFAQRDTVSHDPELLYVSCILHDLALTDAYRASPGGAVECFAVHGGNLAHRELTQRGATSDFAERVADAITLHMNVQVPRTLGNEAHLLHAAAHLDVAGTRAHDLPRGAIRAVLHEHPRDGFPVQFGQLMRREATERPRSRAALLWRLGMRLPVEHNPLDHP